jgi:hypothetical protein
MTTPQHRAIARRQQAPIAIPQTGYVTINGVQHLVNLSPVTPSPLAIRQDDPRPTHYQTAKERNVPQQTPALPKLAISPLSIVLAAICSVSFLVAGSMFSIALTSYSNSVDRIDSQRTDSPFINVQ